MPPAPSKGRGFLSWRALHVRFRRPLVTHPRRRGRDCPLRLQSAAPGPPFRGTYMVFQEFEPPSPWWSGLPHERAMI
jgi:hypothetical protein